VFKFLIYRPTYPPFFSPQGGNEYFLLLPPWGKVGKGVYNM
jgi:hypothetical protein